MDITQSIFPVPLTCRALPATSPKVRGPGAAPRSFLRRKVGRKKAIAPMIALCHSQKDPPHLNDVMCRLVQARALELQARCVVARLVALFCHCL